MNGFSTWSDVVAIGKSLRIREQSLYIHHIYLHELRKFRTFLYAKLSTPVPVCVRTYRYSYMYSSTGTSTAAVVTQLPSGCKLLCSSFRWACSLHSLSYLISSFITYHLQSCSRQRYRTGVHLYGDRWYVARCCSTPHGINWLLMIAVAVLSVVVTTVGITTKGVDSALDADRIATIAQLKQDQRNISIQVLGMITSLLI